MRTANSPQILELLIEYHMDMNACFNTLTLLESIVNICNPYISPILEKIALENGCNSRALNDEGENFLELLAFDIYISWIAECEERIDYLLSLLMIALGYGCTFQDGTIPLEVIDGFDITNFKEYKNYGAESFLNNGRVFYRFYERSSHRDVAKYWIG